MRDRCIRQDDYVSLARRSSGLRGFLLKDLQAAVQDASNALVSMEWVLFSLLFNLDLQVKVLLIFVKLGSIAFA